LKDQTYVIGGEAETAQKPHNKGTTSNQLNALQNDEQIAENQNCALSEHEKDTSLQKKSAIYVQQDSIPDDLRKVFDAWPSLPDTVKSGIIAMVEISAQTIDE
jgi:hypothetical protein